MSSHAYHTIEELCSHFAKLKITKRVHFAPEVRFRTFAPQLPSLSCRKGRNTKTAADCITTGTAPKVPSLSCQDGSNLQTPGHFSGHGHPTYEPPTRKEQASEPTYEPLTRKRKWESAPELPTLSCREGSNYPTYEPPTPKKQAQEEQPTPEKQAQPTSTSSVAILIEALFTKKPPTSKEQAPLIHNAPQTPSLSRRGGRKNPHYRSDRAPFL